jgi:TorA maturation chaperone TorD
VSQNYIPLSVHRRTMVARDYDRPLPAPADSLPSEEQGRADVYALGARLLLASPDDALLRALAEAQDLPGSASAADFDTAWSHLTRAAAVMPAELVSEEFTALFEGLGSPLLDPYGSVYVAGFMMEKPLANLRSDLAALGLARSRNAAVPEDHLGALCEVMRLLIAGAPQFAPRPLAIQRRFFDAHLQPWAGRCLDDIETAKPAGFYGCVARYLRCFLLLEGRAFQLIDAGDSSSHDGPVGERSHWSS